MFSDYNMNYLGLNGYDYQGGYGYGEDYDFAGDYNYRNSSQFGMPNMSNDEIITLNQAIDLIRQSVRNEKDDELFYDRLIDQAPSDKEKKIIESIRNDERKHKRILRQLYVDFTGRPIQPDMSTPSIDVNLSYIENLEKALFGELDAVVKYRKILGTMPSGGAYTLIMSIMTDELRHANKYNFLIHKAGTEKK